MTGVGVVAERDVVEDPEIRRRLSCVWDMQLCLPRPCRQNVRKRGKQNCGVRVRKRSWSGRAAYILDRSLLLTARYNGLIKLLKLT